MSDLDAVLYRWISKANERRDEIGLPVGFLEDGIELLKNVLGADYLMQLLLKDSTPVSFLDEVVNPLRGWLRSPHTISFIVQPLELASYFREFRDDPALADKVTKLQRDSFWPVLFELAMAARMKRAANASQIVHLNHEIETSIGDFTVEIDGVSIPCECSRLGKTQVVLNGKTLEERLISLFRDAMKRMDNPLCAKIRLEHALDGKTYNRILRLVKQGMSSARRSALPAEFHDEGVHVRFELLGAESEKIPFRKVNGQIVQAPGTDWTSALRLSFKMARDFDDVVAKMRKDEFVPERETLRLFLKFPAGEDVDEYKRLESKVGKKLKQTKVSTEHLGKIAFVEIPFRFDSAEDPQIREAVRRASLRSDDTLAVFIAHRHGNPQLRYGFSFSAMATDRVQREQPKLISLFDRFVRGELLTDPVLGSPYQLAWEEACRRTASMNE